MPARDEERRRLLARDRRRTAVWTAIVTAVLLALAVLAPLETRDARGETRQRTTLDVWWTMLNQLPDEAPGLLSRWVLAVLLLLAVVALAYVLVATVELARGRSERDDEHG